MTDRTKSQAIWERADHRAAAEFQVPRIARERGMSEAEVRSVVAAHTEGRQVGFLGESGVNVLELNLDLDNRKPMSHGHQ